MSLKLPPLVVNRYLGLLGLAFAITGASAQSIAPPSLKDAYQGQFYVGVAINRTIATATPSSGRQRQSEPGASRQRHRTRTGTVQPDLSRERPKVGAHSTSAGRRRLRFWPGRRLCRLRGEEPHAHRRPHARLAQSNARLGVRGHNSPTPRRTLCIGASKIWPRL